MDHPSVPDESPFSRALGDLVAGLRRWELWAHVGWNEIRQRYRRSVLGPFWITLSMGIMIGGLGLVYANLWHADVLTYLPYLAVGLVFWGFISTTLLDACQVFISMSGFIRQVQVPLSVYVFQMLWRNLIILAHNLAICVLVLPMCGIPFDLHSLLAVPGLLLIVLNGVWVSLALGMLCARYRDVPQIMLNIVQIMFFLTPVIWTSDRLTRYSLLLEFNPLYHLLELVRAPLLGQMPTASSWLVGIGLLLAGGLVTALVYGRHRSQIAYWV
jgi:ABC-type polysaccharide/polyol phosphate export permease